MKHDAAIPKTNARQAAHPATAHSIAHSIPESAVLSSYPSNTVDWLTRLIGYDTVSRHSNLALIEDVQAYCGELGLAPILTFNSEATKANLFVTLPAGKEGEIISGGIVLSGHTDVVPIDGQHWSSDPFQAEIRGDKLYGRGACDMKGFIAAALNLLPKAAQLSQTGQLQTPLHLALSFDEEVGCLGVPLLLGNLRARGIQPDYCIVGEPSNMKMVVAHKGISVFHCTVHGKSVHSSLTPQGVNAISYAARLIGFIDDLARKLAANGERDPLFDVPFSTLSVGTIQGGTATNIVPNLCQFTFDFRNLPMMSTSAILPPIKQFIATLNQEMQLKDSDSGIVLTQLEDVPALTDSDSEALQALMAGLVQDSARHKVAYATEGGQFSKAGIPTLICGPGSIEQAHKPDEYVTLAQLEQCDAFLQQLLTGLTH